MAPQVTNSEQAYAEKSLNQIANSKWAYYTVTEDGRTSLRIPLLRWIGRFIKFLTLDRFECIRNMFPQKQDVASASSIVKKQIVAYCPEQLQAAPQEKRELLNKVAERFNVVVEKTNPGRQDLKINLDQLYAPTVEAAHSPVVDSVKEITIPVVNDSDSESDVHSISSSPKEKSPVSPGVVSLVQPASPKDVVAVVKAVADDKIAQAAVDALQQQNAGSPNALVNANAVNAGSPNAESTKPADGQVAVAGDAQGQGQSSQTINKNIQNVQIIVRGNVTKEKSVRSSKVARRS